MLVLIAQFMHAQLRQLMAKALNTQFKIFGSVTIKCGKTPGAALSKLSGIGWCMPAIGLDA